MRSALSLQDGGDELLPNGLGGLGLDTLHVIPEMLGSQLRRRSRGPNARQGRAGNPIPHRLFADRFASAVDRAQGLSTGDYIRLAAINRACKPVSKQAMWDWVSRTSLPRVWPAASAAQLTSQHFWDHMERIQPETAQAIWQQLIAAVLQREQIALSQICYDGTNFYTFIDTFNLQSQLAKRGKNKQ